MGRVNAISQPTVRGNRTVTRSRRRPASATSALVSPRALLALSGGVFWFIATTIAEIVNGGPSVDGPLFVLGAVVTILVGGAIGRSWADDIALAVGCVAGIGLSSGLAGVEPAGNAAEDTFTLAFYVGLAVIILTPVVRRVLAGLRGT